VRFDIGFLSIRKLAF